MMVKCTHCGAEGIHQPQGTRGDKSRYVCSVCGKWFSVAIESDVPDIEQPGIDINNSVILKQILAQYTPKELEAIAKGGRIMPGLDPVPVINFSGERIRWGALGDTHLGSIYTHPEHISKAFAEMKKEGCEFVTHSGDVTEGMSNRPGHVYELSHIGYDAQRDHAVEVLSEWEKDIYMISGNHDRWFIKSNGANIVKDIAGRIEKAHFLGHDEGNISLNGKGTLRLWHGEDGNSYATSYRIQKVVESFTGGEKPSVLLLGHTHKQVYIYERHIQCVSTGSIQTQSKWMRGKRIQAHTGFWVIDAWMNDRGVSKFSPTWYPFYI